MIFKKSSVLIIFIILLFSSPVCALDFSGSLTYSGQYNFSEKNLSNNLNLNLNFYHNFTDEIFAEGDLIIRWRSFIAASLERTSA